MVMNFIQPSDTPRRRLLASAYQDLACPSGRFASFAGNLKFWPCHGLRWIRSAASRPSWIRRSVFLHRAIVARAAKWPGCAC